jgi:hypothetical protein
MQLRVVDEDGMIVVEGDPDAPLLSAADDAGRVIEACLSAGAEAALLHAANLPAAFFDLSSGQAAAILQKLRNYRLRLAVVCPPGTVRLSSRFGEVLAEERKDRYFGLFDSRSAAREWLGRS